VVGLLAACGGDSSSSDRDEETDPRPTRPGTAAFTDKMALWDGSEGTHLRGADLHPCSSNQADTCEGPTTEQDVQDLSDLGANLINASYPGVFGEDPPYDVNSATLGYLDDLITWAEEADIFVVIHFRTGPGRNESAIVGEGDPLYDVWTDREARDGWIDMWRFTAERYRETPVVVGYNLMVEPHVNTVIDPEAELGPEAFRAETEGTLQDWNAFAAEISEAIREVDESTPIIVNSLNWGDQEWFAALEPTGDPRTIYSFHGYNPDDYTHQDYEPGSDFDIQYPGEVDVDGALVTFDRDWLEESLRPVVEFSEEHGVPIYVGEFGTMRWVPNAVEFHRDQTAVFEEHGWNYAYYTWRTGDGEWDGFDLEFGVDPESHDTDPENSLLAVHRDRWAQNVDFPSAISSGPSASGSLVGVSHWLYLIDVNLGPETVDLIAASDHDMVVVDFIPSEENNTDYPMASVVQKLHASAIPKLVIAYIDIGEAEDYRTYWQSGWGIGNPEWIAGADPDGWEGNFPVAFWHQEWRDIWLGSDGYLQQIVDAGFDGVYLDWIEAYSDENVMLLAERDGVEPEAEMVLWVGDIATFARSQRPGFIVIGQNATELTDRADYTDIIDALAQEQVWFDGGADNDPPGDCPLPESDDDIDTASYLESLSPRCRSYAEDPDSTLHVSTEEYLSYLELASNEVEIIFTVDYALDPENVAKAYEASRALGFIPFVGSRALDEFLEPVP